MKEFMTSHADLIARGLRAKQTDQGINISKCVNLIAEQGSGLVPYVPPVPPMSRESGLEWNFPYPVLSYGDMFLLFDRTNIYMIEETGAVYEIPIYNVDNESNLVSIPPGRTWSVAQMPKGWIAANGMGIVVLLNHNKMLGGNNKVLLSTNIRADCVAFTKSRMLLGGFDPAHCWSNTWKTYWTGSVTEVSTDGMGMGPNFVWWSCIGGGNLLLELTHRFMTAGFISGANDTKYIESIMRRNDSGYLVLNHPGMVRQLLPYGKSNVIAYTDTGVSLLVQHTGEFGSGYGEFVMPTAGEEYPGIMAKNAAAGDENIQLTLDRYGALWLVADNKIQKLGYEEFFKNWIHGEMTMSFDGRRFYICNNYKCYIFSVDGGLTEINQMVTSVVKIGGELYGICTNELDMDRTATVELSGLALPSSGLEFITGVQISGSHDNTGTAVVEYRHQGDKSYTISDSYIIGPDGYGKLMESGIDLKLRVSFSEFTGIHIANIVTHKQHDAQYVRGIYVT